MLTIGVAIAVPEPHATQLRRHRASFGDPQAQTVPTHVTLLPPTDVDVSELPDVDKHLRTVAYSHCSFEMHLRGSATFRPVSPVVFVAVAAGIGECELLASEVRSGPLDRDVEFPFHPHVTVAHDLPDSELDRAFSALAGYECRFRVDSFVLFTHEGAKGWRPHRKFALAATP